MEEYKWDITRVYDSNIVGVEYDGGNTLLLHIGKQCYEYAYGNVKLCFRAEDDDFVLFFRYKQWARHKRTILFRGKEIRVAKLQRMLRKGASLEVHTIYTEEQNNTVCLACCLGTENNRSRYHHVLIEIEDCQSIEVLENAPPKE